MPVWCGKTPAVGRGTVMLSAEIPWQERAMSTFVGWLWRVAGSGTCR